MDRKVAFENHPQSPVERVLNEHFAKLRDNDPLYKEDRERLKARGMSDFHSWQTDG